MNKVAGKPKACQKCSSLTGFLLFPERFFKHPVIGVVSRRAVNCEFNGAEIPQVLSDRRFCRLCDYFWRIPERSAAKRPEYQNLVLLFSGNAENTAHALFVQGAEPGAVYFCRSIPVIIHAVGGYIAEIRRSAGQHIDIVPVLTRHYTRGIRVRPEHNDSRSIYAVVIVERICLLAVRRSCPTVPAG